MQPVKFCLCALFAFTFCDAKAENHQFNFNPPVISKLHYMCMKILLRNFVKSENYEGRKAED